MIYNSKDKNFKSVSGAVPTEHEVTYRIYAPDYEYAFMLIHKSDEDFKRYPMNKCDDGYFENTISFNTEGLYFYHFELVRDCRRIPVFRAPDGTDTKTGSADWQQTVYKEDFAVPEWINGGIIYQIFPDRFYKADITYDKVFPDRVTAEWGAEPLYANGSVGAVINNDYFGGNLLGIKAKLPYLKELGVTAIYLNPIFEAHSNHRYNTADYMRVDPILGTNEHFSELCKAAKQKGIRIILDGVFSHTGADSIYFNREGRYDSIGAYQSEDSPYKDWYKFLEFPHSYLSWWGFETLPEVIEENESFSNFICGKGGVIDHWMKLGASGFRLDVADELPDGFIKKIRKAVKRNGGILYGEVWEDASNKISYGKYRSFLHGEELDSVMNYPFANLITSFVKGGSGIDFINGVSDIIEHYPEPSLHALMNLLSTHDTERILTVFGGEPSDGRGRQWQAEQKMTDEQRKNGEQLLKLATVLQYTLPGVPSIYYGDEIGLEGYRDPFNRSSFDWSKTDCELCDWYRMLGDIRSKCPALKKGSFLPAQYERGYVSYVRVCDEGELYVIVNPSYIPAEIWLLPGWRNDPVLIGNDPADGILTVPPKSVAVLGRGEWTKQLKKTYP